MQWSLWQLRICIDLLIYRLFCCMLAMKTFSKHAAHKWPLSAWRSWLHLLKSTAQRASPLFPLWWSAAREPRAPTQMRSTSPCPSGWRRLRMQRKWAKLSTCPTRTWSRSTTPRTVVALWTTRAWECTQTTSCTLLTTTWSRTTSKTRCEYNERQKPYFFFFSYSCYCWSLTNKTKNKIHNCCSFIERASNSRPTSRLEIFLLFFCLVLKQNQHFFGQ